MVGSYSCKKERITREDVGDAPDGHLNVIVRKCRCRHVWCRHCGADGVRRAVYSMRGWIGAGSVLLWLRLILSCFLGALLMPSMHLKRSGLLC